ncbi:MAG: FAD-dependent oxidoreductase [Bacteroidota bacterium]
MRTPGAPDGLERKTIYSMFADPLMTSDILIIGGGIFGLSAAIELQSRDYRVCLINPDRIPHPLAASTDISKIVRMEYGSDALYFEMARESIHGWHKWNEVLREKLYHQTGFLLLCRETLNHPCQQFERESARQLSEHGFAYEHLKAEEITDCYPAIGPDVYAEAIFNPIAGYVESGRAIAALAEYARKIGVKIEEGQTAEKILIENGVAHAVQSREGKRFSAGHILLTAGTGCMAILPELKQVMQATGHPVYHFRPTDPSLFQASQLPVFAADISNTGWYGFPWHPKEGVVKIARHAKGLLIDPEKDDRRVSDTEVKEAKRFLRQSFPQLAGAPLVFTRRCLYSDTQDGHFWIDQHPEIRNLSVSTGGSGHGMKMGPVLGQLTADMIEGKAHPCLSRFSWRSFDGNVKAEEEARAD